jgi:ketol-acid reductoisomerase
MMQAMRQAATKQRSLALFKKPKSFLPGRSFVSAAPSSMQQFGQRSGALQQSMRSVHTLNYGAGIPSEEVFEASDYPTEKILDVLKNETIAVIGYGPQGRGQCLNLRDTGLGDKITVGVREGGESWNLAIEDGWVPGKNLFPIKEAAKKGSVVMFMVSDAAQIQVYPEIRDILSGESAEKPKTLYFSHGFGVIYQNLTNIDVDSLKNLDVILVAPKGSGKSVRELYKQGKGINASYAVHRDDSGKAQEKALAIGFGVGSPYIYETTFEKEVTSDLTGERCILMGGIAGLFKAQYEVLRQAGHSPSEAFNETVEEALQSLYPLINEHGMDYMFANTSTTAQRGALDWSKKFEELNKPLIAECYAEVKNQNEAKRTIECNSRDTYRADLNKELEEIDSTEIWRVGREIRKLRKS